MSRKSEPVPKLRTLAAIASVYATNQRTVSDWKRDDTFPKPDDDGFFDLAAVGAWISAKSTPETDLERARKLRLECDRLEIKLAQERRETTTLTEVETEWQSIMVTIRSEMEKTRRDTAPKVSKLNAAETLEILEARDRAIMDAAGEVGQ